MQYYPKVSIITTVFNGVKEIEQTILSVINQTYKNMEYIIIDGGSNDGTVEIIKKYQHYLSYWISEKDNGIYDGMNKGLMQAKGEWVLFRNSGDYFSSLSDIENVFNGIDYSRFTVLAGKAVLCNKFGYKIANPEFIEKNRAYVMPVWHPSTFVKTTYHQNKPFNTTYHLAADHDFFYKYSVSGLKFHYVPFVLSIFNIENGASVNGQSKSVIEHFYIHGGNGRNYWGLCILYIKVLKIRIILSIKKYIPSSLMKIRKKKQGYILWTDDFTYEDMVKMAVTKLHTDIL